MSQFSFGFLTLISLYCIQNENVLFKFVLRMFINYSWRNCQYWITVVYLHNWCLHLRVMVIGWNIVYAGISGYISKNRSYFERSTEVCNNAMIIIFVNAGANKSLRSVWMLISKCSCSLSLLLSLNVLLLCLLMCTIWLLNRVCK